MAQTLAAVHASDIPHGADSNLGAESRPKRQRAEPHYDEVTRRGPRVSTEARGYMDRGNGRGGKRGVAAMIMGEAAVERVVQGRYDWRDRGLPAPGDRQIRN